MKIKNWDWQIQKQSLEPLKHPCNIKILKCLDRWVMEKQHILNIYSLLMGQKRWSHGGLVHIMIVAQPGVNDYRWLHPQRKQVDGVICTVLFGYWVTSYSVTNIKFAHKATKWGGCLWLCCLDCLYLGSLFQYARLAGILPTRTSFPKMLGRCVKCYRLW